MPNWCENKLEICLSNIKQLDTVNAALFSLDENNEQWLDFNLIVPMPESLLITCGSIGHKSQALLETCPHQLLTHERMNELFRGCPEAFFKRIETLAFDHCWTIADLIQWLKNNPEEQKRGYLDLDLGQQYIDNMKTYGCTTWYDWACQHWGTKWNSQECSIDVYDNKIIVYFDTAWSPPEPWFEALCDVFPNVSMSLFYYEPGCFYAGELVADKQGGYDSIIPETDQDIKELARDVFGEVFEDEADDEADDE